ncbi:MAG: serine/threonine-protein kinase [Rudaea sp.]|nr:serine/threonine-protein kinase [Rudaea sp.]
MHADDANPSPDTDFAASASESYARLRELFAAVADIEDAARPAWLAAHVPDAEERKALERLLEVDRLESGYLETPADEHAARMAADEPVRPEGLIGQSIGAFRLTRLLGKGGMAVVFLGVREGADFQQRVAVKLLRRGLYSEIEQRLFRRERQLLASLDHPNIARLIDGGVTAAGIPYLVIEYVDGDPVTRHASDRRLGVRERLNLFLVACRAVEAAHRALIVHRDIKPSNILVASDGTVKLLDFGIAKLLEGIAKLLEEDVESATVGVFTPDYAAPEQLNGTPVTTATDVYALGVLLHELLLGVRPRGNPTRRPSSLADAAADKHARPLNPAQLARSLRGDLDTILLKCLAAEPERRYASAGALADDIQRHLNGQPVEAHPPSRWYRTRKFVQRHRGSVTATAVFLLAVVASLGLALWQARVARSQASRAREIQAFVESLFEPLEEGIAADKAPSLQELLQRGISRVDSSFHDDLSAQAELLAMFSRIQDQLGEIKSNRDLSERAYRVTERLYGANDARTLDTREKHARILYRLGEYDAASSELTAVRTAMRANQIGGTSLAVTLEDISFVRYAEGAKDEELIPLNEEALKERLADPESKPENLAAGYNNLALAYAHADQLDRALELMQKAHDLFVQAKGESYVSATSLANIGGIQFRLGRWREGLKNQIQAREMFQRLGIDSHQMLAGVLMGICETETQLELYELAHAACDDEVAMVARVQGESHPRFARALALRASAEIGAAQFDAAEADLDRARGIVAGMKTDPAPARRGLDLVFAKMDRIKGDYARLREHLNAPIASSLKSGDSSAPVAFAWFALACEHVSGEGCEAGIAARAQDAAIEPKFAHNPNLLAAENTLAQIDLLHHDPAAAIVRIRNALAVAEAELGEKHSWVGEAHLLLGDAQAALGDHEAAGREYATALSVLGALPGNNPLRAQAESHLGQNR